MNAEIQSRGADEKIAIIGLGYVGLPLAIEFSKVRDVIGFDINPERIAELQQGKDHTQEVTDKELLSAHRLTFSTDVTLLQQATIFVITVPTPIDEHKKPNLDSLKEASEIVGKSLKKNDLVIYESTVYPGCTEEVCVPILSKTSGLRYNIDFFCGYSPERINPGDKTRRLSDIVKITSGSTPAIANKVDQLYQLIVKAGTYKATSLKVAEAAKIIENCQRDVNIAFANELALICEHLNIDTHEVIQAAASKWNFLFFKPGLVGGHCIGVDPYYLTYKMQSLNYYPEIILSGRRINDNMGKHIAGNIIQLMIKHDLPIKTSKILILGITFKENCPDIRNSQVVTLVRALLSYYTQVDIYDPNASAKEVKQEYDLQLVPSIPEGQMYGVVILAVAHHQFTLLSWEKFTSPSTIVYDIKGILDKKLVTSRL